MHNNPLFADADANEMPATSCTKLGKSSRRAQITTSIDLPPSTDYLTPRKATRKVVVSTKSPERCRSITLVHLSVNDPSKGDICRIEASMNVRPKRTVTGRNTATQSVRAYLSPRKRKHSASLQDADDKRRNLKTKSGSAGESPKHKRKNEITPTKSAQQATRSSPKRLNKNKSKPRKRRSSDSIDLPSFHDEIAPRKTRQLTDSPEKRPDNERSHNPVGFMRRTRSSSNSPKKSPPTDPGGGGAAMKKKKCDALQSGPRGGISTRKTRYLKQSEAKGPANEDSPDPAGSMKRTRSSSTRPKKSPLSDPGRGEAATKKTPISIEVQSSPFEEKTSRSTRNVEYQRHLAGKAKSSETSTRSKKKLPKNPVENGSSRKEGYKHFCSTSLKKTRTPPRAESSKSTEVEIKQTKAKKEASNGTKVSAKSPKKSTLGKRNNKLIIEKNGVLDKSKKSLVKCASTDSDDLPLFHKKAPQKGDNQSETFKKYGIIVPSIEEMIAEKNDLVNYRQQVEEAQKIKEPLICWPTLATKELFSEPLLDCKDLTLEELTEHFKSNVTFLTGITEGKTFSERHRRFHDANQWKNKFTNRALTYSTSTIVFTFDQIDHMASLIEERFDGGNQKSCYVFQVLLPELCLKIFMSRHDMSKTQATKYLDMRPVE